MPNKSAALEKEMKVRSAKPNKWLRFYRCIPLYLMFLPGACICSWISISR